MHTLRPEVITSPRRVPKPWGYEIWFATTEHYTGKVLHVDAGECLSLQFHERKDEACYLLSGRVRLSKGALDDLNTVEVAPGQTWRNLPGEIHSIEALEDSEVLGVSTPELDDIVRLADRYGRGGTTAP